MQVRARVEVAAVGGVLCPRLERKDPLAQDLEVFKLAPPLALLADPLEHAPIQHLPGRRLRLRFGVKLRIRLRARARARVRAMVRVRVRVTSPTPHPSRPAASPACLTGSTRGLRLGGRLKEQIRLPAQTRLPAYATLAERARHGAGSACSASACTACTALSP